MYKRLAPVLVFSLLSGCSLVNGDQYHQENLQAIKASEKNVNVKISELNLQLRKQSQQISSLRSEVSSLNSDIEKYHKDNQAKSAEASSAAAAKQPSPTASQVQQTPSNKIVLGELEKVHIDSLNKSFTARIDTGASISSLNAVDIQEFERNGQQWVKFHLFDGKQAIDEKNWVEAPILKHVKVRQATVSKAKRRAVIELWIKVGKIHEKVQFNLADRTQMKYPILLGREFIRDIATVDVSKQFLQSENK
ncbi:ATP-dependent zinc protease family protein [Vibrio marisflavi]|uniref:Retropepsin-like aspartic endopeptidase domain-containing protein n=1 Tax=Vibrio marisflavi CECT 7928 TaxID=634439 RepID=A0ABN8E8G9_9VIBR|nr:ATP-dependent zinc protease [Vibrio marisflavi]CAH0540536.1 hypothetical protein VMF7928_02936 [Vibrio marisflavi CECT 7928]